MLKKKSKSIPEASSKPSLALALGAQKYGKKKMAAGGKTDAKNGGGMDPSDDKDKTKMALGGAVESPSRSGRPYDRNPGTPAKKSDNTRYPDSETMTDEWSKGNPPARKPDDERRPKSAYLDTNDWSDGMKPSRAAFAEGGPVTTKPNAPRPAQADYESEDLNARASRYGMTLDQMAERHEQEAAKFRMMAEGGMIGEVSGRAQATQAPGVPMRKPDDMRPPKNHYMADQFNEGSIVDSIAETIMRKMANGGMVDLEHNSEEEPNQYYDANEDTANEEQYDDSQISAQPENSNEKGDEREKKKEDHLGRADGLFTFPKEDSEEEDEHDMVSAIRKKVQAKKGR